MSDGDNDPNAGHLVGFWDFLKGRENEDTGLADGVAQNGQTFGDADTSRGGLVLDGHKDYFSTHGSDAAFDLTQGTVAVGFTQTDQASAILVNRGTFNDRFQDGYFALGVTGGGRVTVTHFCDEARLKLKTPDRLFTQGDAVKMTYGWSAEAGGTLRVDNLTQGTTDRFDFDTVGLELTTHDDHGENFTFGARETHENRYAKFFEGEIDYVAVYDRDILNNPVSGDGVVSGTAAADVIDVSYIGDPQGDRIDAGDAVDASAGPNDDIVDAGAGGDTLRAGLGDDKIYAGAGSDRVEGGAGDDLIYGDRTLAGNASETPDMGIEREVLRWDAAPDPNGADPIDDGDPLAGGFVQNTGSVKVTFAALDAGDAATTFAGNTQYIGGIEADGDPVATQSSAESLIRGNGLSATYEITFDTAVTNVDFRINDIDGDGVVQVTAFDAAGTEIPTALAGGNRLRLTDTGGASGVDTATSPGGYSSDTDPRYSLLVGVGGPVSRIVIRHAQDGHANTGINLTDVYFDASVILDDDTLYGGAGDDTIFGESGDDVIFGEAGNDVISGGDGADTLDGGDDRDRFIDVGAGDIIDGGDGGDDHDTLDLTGSAGGGSFTVAYTSDDQQDGVVDYLDANGDAAGQLVFSEIETILGITPICFTPGTLIATPNGACAVQDLRPGDRVITRDNGIQEICWKGQRHMTGVELACHPHHKPIRIRKGALGRDLPLRDMLLSPHHRVLVSNKKTTLYFEESEVLVAAKHLTGMRGIEVATVPQATYIHVMCAQHEVLLSDGTWTESFQPGDHSLAGIEDRQRVELEHLFPELKTPAGVASYHAARRSLKGYEAELLTE